MKRLVKSAFLCLTLVTVFFTFACHHGKENGKETSSPYIKLGDVEGVEITPPASGIVGEEAPSNMPGSGGIWKGVFIKDRTVKLSTYAIGKTEVTYELWKKVYDWAVKQENGYKFANKGLEGFINEGGGGSWPDYANIGKKPTENSRHPVTMVSWRDCIVWCNAYTQMLNESEEECVYRVSETHSNVLKDATDGILVDSAYADMDKKGFRLPTEAEWEYAARLKSDKVNLIPVNYASGATGDWNNYEATKAVAWYSVNSDGKTHSVGGKKPNGIGLYDMSGNVWEWCFDCYGGISSGDVTDPVVASGGNYRVLRGGGWYYHAEDCVVGFRNGYPLTAGSAMLASAWLGALEFTNLFLSLCVRQPHRA